MFVVRISIIFLTVLTILALIAPLLPGDPNYCDLYQNHPLPPSSKYWFGSDDLGRDLFLRCLYGARISLMVSFSSIVISLIFGSLLGIFSGFFQGWVDTIVGRFSDVFMSVPTIFLILFIQSIMEPHLIQVILVLGLTGWMGVYRLVRAEALSISHRRYVLAAKGRAIGQARLMFVHMLPNLLGPIMVSVSIGVNYAILSESMLSFLGFGVQPPHSSWGNLLQNSLSYMQTAPWMIFFPGLFIIGTVLSLTFIGEHCHYIFLQKNNVKG